MRARIVLSSGLALLLVAVVLAQPPVGDKPADKPRLDFFGDPLPEGAIFRLGTSRLRSDQSINHLAFVPGGKELVTASYSNRLLFWDVKTGKQTRSWTLSSSGIYGLSFDKEGKRLAVSDSNGTVRILDGKTGSELKNFVDPNNRYNTAGVVLSPDGKTALMMILYNRTLLVCDVDKGTIKHRYQNVSTYNPASFAFTPDSKSFVGLWTDNRLNVVEVESGKARNLELTQPAGNVQSSYSSRIAAMALTPDGKQMIYRPTSDRFYTVVEMSSGKQLKRIDRASTTYSYNNGSMTVTPNGRFFMEASGDTNIKVWGVASGKAIRELNGPTNMYRHAMSSDGKMVAASSGNCIVLWDVASGKQLHAGHGHGSQVYRVAFSGDGRYLISSGNNNLRVWDMKDGKQLHLAPAYGSSSSTYFTLSEDGKAARWIGYNRAVYQWKVGVDRVPVTLTTPRNLNVYFNHQAVSPDGKWLAGVNSNDRKLRLIDLLGTKPDKELITLPQSYYSNLSFTPDGRKLAVSAADRSITIFDIPSGDQVKKIMGDAPNPGGYYYSAPPIYFSGNGRSLITFDQNGEGKILEVLTGNPRVMLGRDQYSSPNAVTWSHDNRLFARSSYDGTVSVTDALSGRELLRRQTGQGSVIGLAFSKDGRKLATGGANTTVMVWDVPPPSSRPPIGVTLDQKTAWRDLEDAEAAKAFRAMAYLYSAPTSTLKLFRTSLKPRQPTDPGRIGQLIKDLDDDKFMTREKASDELAELGSVAEEALKKATKGESLEVRRRAQDLLRRLKGGIGVAPDRLRAFRAVEVLEMIGTAEAKVVLKEMLKSKIDKALEASVKETLVRLGEVEDPTKPGTTAKP